MSYRGSAIPVAEEIFTIPAGSPTEYYFSYSRIHDISPSIQIKDASGVLVNDPSIQTERLSWNRCRVSFSGSPSASYTVVVRGLAPKFVEALLWTGTTSGFYEIHMQYRGLSSTTYQLTDYNAQTLYAVLHPNGRQIIFGSTKDSANRQLFAADISFTGGLTNVTNLLNDSSTNWRTSFSPDGTKIVWTTDDGLGGASLYKADYDASTKTISNKAFVVNSSGDDESGFHAFNPDATKIAYMTNLTFGGSNRRIRTINYDGTGDSGDFTNGIAGDIYPAWHPLNEYIAFTGTGDSGTDRDIILTGVNNNGVRTDITQNSIEEPHCSWSPDGNYLTYKDGAANSVKIITKSGGSPTTIFTGALNEQAFWGRILL